MSDEIMNYDDYVNIGSQLIEAGKQIKVMGSIIREQKIEIEEQRIEIKTLKGTVDKVTTTAFENCKYHEDYQQKSELTLKHMSDTIKKHNPAATKPDIIKQLINWGYLKNTIEAPVNDEKYKHEIVKGKGKYRYIFKKEVYKEIMDRLYEEIYMVSDETISEYCLKTTKNKLVTT